MRKWGTTLSRQTDALIAEAKRYLGVVEEPKNSNRGLCIDYWIREAGLDPAGAYPWCAAFVGQMGRQAVGASWPVPRTAGVAAIAAWAATKAVIRTRPEPGDLFLLWSDTLKRFAHIGIVTKYDAGTDTFETIEGNTNGGGSREGFGVFARRRTALGNTKFVRWEAAA